MKNNIDVYAIVFGAIASFLKARKMNLKLKELIFQVVIGGILAFLTLGVLDYFFANASPRILIGASFVVGWSANELTDLFDKAIRDGYEIGKGWLTKKVDK